MGIHAFSSPPEHCDVYRALYEDFKTDLFGLDDKWNIVAAGHRRDLGAGIDFAGVDHYILTYHVDGGPARRVDRKEAMAGAGALSMQRPGSGGRFASSGMVEYWHLYFRQSLLCEVAEAAQLIDFAEPADFFAVFDKSLGKEVAAFILRAGDCEDPPISIEMDSRAYLIALGLLRLIRHRDGKSLVIPDIKMRAELKIVMDAIEDRIAEQIRLHELAELIGMSPFHFARTFKAVTGKPPAQYVQERRTWRAVDMIRNSRMPLAEIAYQTGFSSQSHMGRWIKSLTDETPSAHRRRK